MSSVLEPAIEPRQKPTKTENGNPIIYTGPSYTYDSGRKTCKGSYLSILKNGKVTYNNPNCLEYAAPGSKPFKLSALNPRIEEPAKTFERLKAGIEKRAEKDHMKNFARLTGRPCFDGWTLAVTDGKTALLTHEEPEGEHFPAFDLFKNGARLVCSIDNPEFHLALKRALIMCEEKSPMVRIIANSGQVTLTSEHAEPYGQINNNDAGNFEETLPVNCCDSWHIAINGNFLETVCGAWPLSVWYKDEESPVMFESEDASWRFVIMPMKVGWGTVDLSAREIPADEISNGPDLMPIKETTIARPTVRAKVPVSTNLIAF